ncbi:MULTISPECIES: tRNA 2-thiocytidine(32) synthetase TtcA [Gammaproteobacteria]|uniref:tRNA 2-thiocytidine(32) synthetase TtcA n=1 Tax=Gammaproteobacteria TaxID=1236 RepID=UPI000DCFBA0B|nr:MULTISPECIES: tRNA 2-thiocytidine(32) synthetase TtcA [Gammaproteobacteria]RTE87249.1 tRNA 2-thiocytidine(32) synthetase TtcA [Aliidiomarina sp. B3213]TCZ92964.1 tRNA 2-thiocytidine(32) synthetase TtcA [Lysobacter sp. N42]
MNNARVNLPEQPEGELKSKQSSNVNKLEKRIRRVVGQAIGDFNMIEDGDRIMVCLSGGKDSYTLLSCLQYLQKVAPIHFEIIAVNLDQKQPGFPEHVLPEYLQQLNVPYEIVEEDTYSIVKDKIPEGKTTCSLCSRLRRGILYKTAKRLGCTKIALGHHRDDMIETLMLNMFYGGTMKSMPPKLVSDNGEHIVIRPLAYVKEKDIERYARAMNYPIIPCNLCGSQENLQRKVIKEMLQTWDKQYPGRIESMFKAMTQVVPSHLPDRDLYNFKDVKTGEQIESGDTAFDQEPLPWRFEDTENTDGDVNSGDVTPIVNIAVKMVD